MPKRLPLRKRLGLNSEAVSQRSSFTDAQDTSAIETPQYRWLFAKPVGTTDMQLVLFSDLASIDL
jgi:hypothetical protein